MIVLEMNCLRSLVGVSLMDRIRNEEVRKRAGIERELASRADQRVLRWLGHVERMDEYRMARRVFIAEISGGLVRGKPRLGWANGIKMALGISGADPWYICNCMSVTQKFFLDPVFFRTALPCSGGYQMERYVMSFHDAVGINWKNGTTTENQGAYGK